MAGRKPAKGKLGFRPKKRLGQHFLKDPGIVQEIIHRAGFDPSDPVLEIGPGLGALTLPLSESVYHIMAVEKDQGLVTELGKRLSRAGIDNVDLIHDDILRLDFNQISGLVRGKINLIGNLPYNISSPFLEKLVENRNLVKRAVLMFQYEVGRRLIANPGTREFGALSILMQYHAQVSPLVEVPKEAFYPRPKVTSMVLEMDFEKPHPRRSEDEAEFKKVVKGAFAHRRKTLLNALKMALRSHSTEQILAALEDCQIYHGRRAETLGIDDFLCLTSALRSLP